MGSCACCAKVEAVVNIRPIRRFFRMVVCFLVAAMLALVFCDGRWFTNLRVVEVNVPNNIDLE